MPTQRSHTLDRQSMSTLGDDGVFFWYLTTGVKSGSESSTERICDLSSRKSAFLSMHDTLDEHVPEILHIGLSHAVVGNFFVQSLILGSSTALQFRRA